jgi:UDP-N-acetylmuramoylalanine--D-glutamate ligase
LPSSELTFPLSGKKVLVVGLGLQGGGVGVVRYLMGRGAHVTVTDLKDERQLEASLAALAGFPVRYILGTNEVPNIAEFDLVVRNPAVPLDAPVLNRARELGIPITMEMNLFFRECQGKVVGVTGTKGKSTTAALIAHLLRQRYTSVVLAGNLGISALDQLDRCGPNTIVVLELSSWQLEGLGEERLSPDLAVVTRVFPDHMDVYRDFYQYLEAKLQIVRHQNRHGCLIVCRGDDYWGRFALEARGRVVTYDTARSPADVWVEGGWVWTRGPGWRPLGLASLRGWKLSGSHNLSNLAAAVAAGLELGLSGADIEAGIGTFSGLAHRLELVGEVYGIKFVNDSAATIPEAAASAVRAFRPDRLILICGGSDKGLDPSPLAEAASGCKALALLAGNGTPPLIEAIERLGRRPQWRQFSRLEEALEWCAALAEPGDTVLLSPGYASFGLFVNYRERGERFRAWVKEWQGTVQG